MSEEKSKHAAEPDPPVIRFPRRAVDICKPPAASDETYQRYRAFVARAVEVFGDELVASEWLRTPQPALENKSPLDVAQEQGFESAPLEQMLGRLEHGVFA